MKNYTGEPSSEELPRNPDDSLTLESRYPVDPDPAPSPLGEDGEYEAALFEP